MEKYLVKLIRNIILKDGTYITSEFEKIVVAGNTIDAEHIVESNMLGWVVTYCDSFVNVTNE